MGVRVGVGERVGWVGSEGRREGEGGWVGSEGEGKSSTGNEDGSGRGKKGC